MGILLDTTVIIDHFNAIPQAREFILDNPDQLFLSVITRAEVSLGIAPDNLSLAKSFLDFFPTLPLMVEDADIAADLQRIEKWKLPDAI